MYDRSVERCDSIQSSTGHDSPELVTIRQFGNMSEAPSAQGCLDSAGIETFMADANLAGLEWPVIRGLRLQVNAEDAETLHRAVGAIVVGR